MIRLPLALLLGCLLINPAFAAKNARKTASHKPNLHCENDEVEFSANLTDDFELSPISYSNKIGDKQEKSWDGQKTASHEISKGPDKGMTEFELGVFETNCELFLRLKSAKQVKHAVLREACGDGGSSSAIECTKE